MKGGNEDMTANNDNKNNNLTLRVIETNPKFVGRGIAFSLLF